MPQSLVQALINTDEQLSSVAARWRERSGIISNVWHNEYRRRVLANLIELAQNANSNKTDLLLRVNV
jgi:siderophore synthetase component